jgi:hypothetical protein
MKGGRFMLTQTSLIANNYWLESPVNRYLAEARAVNFDQRDPHISRRTVRDRLVRTYSWAIPDDRAIRTLLDHAPLVEIGAGTGYWAYLIRQCGGDIIAYDIKPLSPGHDNGYFHYEATTWTEVLEGDVQVLDGHPDRTLFLCWPPHDTDMALGALCQFRGDTVIYVGEQEGGCTGTDHFFQELEDNWYRDGVVPIPQWDGMHDSLYIYNRKTVAHE